MLATSRAQSQNTVDITVSDHRGKGKLLSPQNFTSLVKQFPEVKKMTVLDAMAY
jgi:hypothetical protein